jgi:molybdopterin/thiamine biosynthesis adenylyltransferase
MFAMAGTKKVMVFDDDTIEIHNLPRLDAPMTCLGKNKAALLSEFVKQMRPDADFTGYHFKFNPDVIDMEEVDIIVDCTDKHDVQIANKEIADENGADYVKAGYNGRHITIAQSLPMWDTGNHQDGYTIVPSFVSPAVIVAGYGSE